MEILRKPRRSSKTTFTATHRKARYIGDHPHLVDSEGVYYYSTSQQSYVYRPNGLGKVDWYRVLKYNLVDEHDNPEIVA